jgi:hypothetical protein
MNLKSFDYECPRCGRIQENVLVTKEEEDNTFCGECSEETGENVRMVKHQPAPSTPTTTVPTYPGSQKLKAGYQHKFTNRPATKTQIGPGGSVSVDHPTGSTKNN